MKNCQKKSTHHYYSYFCKTLCLSVIRKFFPLDKNYLLEEAQLSLQDFLLTNLIERVKAAHQHIHNPLDLNDAFSNQIKTYVARTLKPLHAFYQNLAAVYRFKHGDNQLQFLWDGSNHLEVYKTEWAQTFRQWTDEFCQRELFIQAVLDLSVFLPTNRHADLAEDTLHTAASNVFYHNGADLIASELDRNVTLGQ